MGVVAQLRDADQRLYVKGEQPYVAPRGWGVYRRWMGENREGAVGFVEMLADRIGAALRSDLTPQDLERVRDAIPDCLRGIHNLEVLIYRDDLAVAKRAALAYAAIDTLRLPAPLVVASPPGRGERSRSRSPRRGYGGYGRRKGPRAESSHRQHAMEASRQQADGDGVRPPSHHDSVAAAVDE